MPSSSQKQHNFMAAVANSPSFASKVGVSPSVGGDFLTADARGPFDRSRAHAIGRALRNKAPKIPTVHTPSVAGRDQVTPGSETEE